VVIALPIAVGIAILRFRLYDIDRLINLTLVYGLLTVSTRRCSRLRHRYGFDLRSSGCGPRESEQPASRANLVEGAAGARPALSS
jgi:hypothetical protein